MNNPFQKHMPLRTDVKIRIRLLRAWCYKHVSIILGLFFAPVLAAWLFIFAPATQTELNQDEVLAGIQTAQAAELEKASGAIYHVVREVKEGPGKAGYVALTTGKTTAPQIRIDRVETFQHSDTALTLVESNEAERPFEVFLSREHDETTLALHHFGPKEKSITDSREVFNQVHNIRDLYESYTSLERPGIPVLNKEAKFLSFSSDNATALFRTIIDEATYIESVVDVQSKLVTREHIFVIGNDGVSYEMSTITYEDRTIIPATEFEAVFAADQYQFEIVDSRAFNQT